MLTLKNIKKIYEQSDEAVLDDINLTFNRDEFVSILGCSGAGKSTLLNIIGGLDCKTSGKLLINGKIFINIVILILIIIEKITLVLYFKIII